MPEGTNPGTVAALPTSTLPKPWGVTWKAKAVCADIQDIFKKCNNQKPKKAETGGDQDQKADGGGQGGGAAWFLNPNFASTTQSRESLDHYYRIALPQTGRWRDAFNQFTEMVEAQLDKDRALIIALKGMQGRIASLIQAGEIDFEQLVTLISAPKENLNEDKKIIQDLNAKLLNLQNEKKTSDNTIESQREEIERLKETVRKLTQA